MTADSGPTATGRPGGGDVCSAAHAGWLVTPLRRLLHDPRRILAGLIAPGATAIDFGCGPGFFTLPMADMVGRMGWSWPSICRAPCSTECGCAPSALVSRRVSGCSAAGPTPSASCRRPLATPRVRGARTTLFERL